MADSVSEKVGDVARAAVEELALPKPNATPATAIPCVKRKTPSVPEGNANGLPEIVISVGEEGAVEILSTGFKLKTYPVAATVVTRGGLKAADDPTVRAARERIETKFEARATWVSVPGFVIARITNRAPFEATALNKDYNYATVVADVQVAEVRT